MFKSEENPIYTNFSIVECREENLYALTEKDKERIAALTKDNDSYEKLFGVRIDIWTHFMRECIINYVH